MKLSKSVKWAVLFATTLLAGCDLTIPYVSTLPLPEKGTTKVAVVAVDERPDVLSHDNPSDYVGIWRAGFGNPYNRFTDGHKPLADDFSATIVNSLEGSGFQAVAVTTQPAKDASGALALLGRSDANRRVLVEIRKWESDTYINPTMRYDASLHVYDSNGKELASKTDTKEVTLDGSAMNSLGHSVDVLQQFYEGKIKEWFSDPAIEAALQE